MIHTEKSSEMVCLLKPASMIVANLYKIREITPADTAPRNVWTGEGGPLVVSIVADPIAFNVSNASSFTDFSPEDLNC